MLRPIPVYVFPHLQANRVFRNCKSITVVVVVFRDSFFNRLFFPQVKSEIEFMNLNSDFFLEFPGTFWSISPRNFHGFRSS